MDNSDVEQTLLSMFHGMWQSRCLGVVVGLNIPEFLCNAEQSSIGIDDLAQKAGCASSEQLYPVMRALAQWGTGIELPNKQFTKNQAMELLRKDQGPSIGCMVGYFCSDENWAVMLALPEAVKTGKPAFPLEHGMTHYQYMSGIESHPYDPSKKGVGGSIHALGSHERRQEYSAIYNKAMAHINGIQVLHKSFKSRSIYDVFPWSSCTGLMDIGGSTGWFLASVLKLPGCEHIHGVLVDLPAVIEKARQIIPGYGINPDRIQLVGHDCFEPFPDDLPRVDTIMCKNFFEGFSASDCTKIMMNVRAALGPTGGRFLVISAPLNSEPCDTQHTIAENGLQPGFNGVHIATLGGIKRSRSEWETYLGLVGSRASFKLSNVYETAFGGASLFELVTI